MTWVYSNKWRETIWADFPVSKSGDCHSLFGDLDDSRGLRFPKFYPTGTKRLCLIGFSISLDRVESYVECALGCELIFRSIRWRKSNPANRTRRAIELKRGKRVNREEVWKIAIAPGDPEESERKEVCALEWEIQEIGNNTIKQATSVGYTAARDTCDCASGCIQDWYSIERGAKFTVAVFGKWVLFMSLVWCFES